MRRHGQRIETAQPRREVAENLFAHQLTPERHIFDIRDPEPVRAALEVAETERSRLVRHEPADLRFIDLQLLGEIKDEMARIERDFLPLFRKVRHRAIDRLGRQTQHEVAPVVIQRIVAHFEQPPAGRNAIRTSDDIMQLHA